MTTTPTLLPGRAVDLVHAAMLTAGLHPFLISVRLHPAGGLRQVSGHAHEHTTEQEARAVFAALGVTDPVLGPPYGSSPRQQANLTGHVPALGTELMILVTGLPPRPEPGDVEALTARVDAARTAQHEMAEREPAR
jgi:hypothetical protein